LTLWAAGLPAVAFAQAPAPAPAYTPAPAPFPAPVPTGVIHADGSAGTAGGVVPVGCASCGGGLLGSAPLPPQMGLDSDCPNGCCGSSPCYPGLQGCDCCCDGKGPVARFLCGVYKCICCPDPCYEGSWIPLANAAFFVDTVRPATQIRLRGDFQENYSFPDKAEFLFAQENHKGPHFPGSTPGGTLAAPTPAPGAPAGTTTMMPAGAKPPGSPSTDVNDGYLYMETAVNNFSFFTELSYRNVEPLVYPGASGFGDLNIGTKSMLIDCELLQFTFQFKAFFPTGNFTKGVGTGHTSLEPSLLMSIKVTPVTYFEAQLAYWFPLGGTGSFEGPIGHYHVSLNQLLLHCGHDIQLIGTLEAGVWDISGGAYTSPLTGLPLEAKHISDIVNLGPGLRLSICNKIDIGGACLFAATRDRMSQEFGRVEFRWRF
jgi:hypothetical protein